MKKLLFIFVLIPFLGIGQLQKIPYILPTRIDTSTILEKDGLLYVKPDSTIHGYFTKYKHKSDSADSKLDAIPVILLVCDTTTSFQYRYEYQSCQDVNCPDSIRHKSSLWTPHMKKVEMSRWQNNTVFWMNGFEVRSKKIIAEYEHCWNYPEEQSKYKYSYKHFKYLNSSKKLLKNIVVWQSKNR